MILCLVCDIWSPIEQWESVMKYKPLCLVCIRVQGSLLHGTSWMAWWRLRQSTTQKHSWLTWNLMLVSRVYEPWNLGAWPMYPWETPPAADTILVMAPNESYKTISWWHQTSYNINRVIFAKVQKNRLQNMKQCFRKMAHVNKEFPSFDD